MKQKKGNEINSNFKSTSQRHVHTSQDFQYSRSACWQIWWTLELHQWLLQQVAKSWARLKETIFTDFIPAPLVGIRVVYHLRGQSGRFTANGGQNSELVNFIAEVAFTIWRNQFHWPKKRSPKPETGIKHGFEQMEDKFPCGILRPEKQDYLFRCSVAPGNFPLERPKRSCYIYFPTGYSGNVFWIVNKHGLTLKFLQFPE